MWPLLSKSQFLLLQLNHWLWVCSYAATDGRCSLSNLGCNLGFLKLVIRLTIQPQRQGHWGMLTRAHVCVSSHTLRAGDILLCCQGFEADWFSLNHSVRTEPVVLPQWGSFSSTLHDHHMVSCEPNFFWCCFKKKDIKNCLSGFHHFTSVGKFTSSCACDVTLIK